MNIRIRREVVERFPEDDAAKFGLESWNMVTRGKYAEFDLRPYSVESIKLLRRMVEKHSAPDDGPRKGKKERGTNQTLQDIDFYLDALASGPKAIPRTVRQFSGALTSYLAGVPGHRVYAQDASTGLKVAYYVNKVEYHPEHNSQDNHWPARTIMTLLHDELGSRSVEKVQFEDGDINNQTVTESLAQAGYFAETDELRNDYLRARDLFEEYIQSVGRQFHATGIASTSGVDGNGRASRDGGDRWWRRGSDRIMLDKDGEPANVVIDVLNESDEDKHYRDSRWASGRHGREEIKWDFWTKKQPIIADEDGETDEEDSEATPESLGIEVPVHPTVIVFNLRKHLRCQLDVRQLTPYQYNPRVGDDLVLPEDVRDAVDMLVAGSATTFIDVVKGKSGGTIIMLKGPPGVGKTLTAEVYAEVSERPLYSVQASQLGTSVDDLEDELLRVLARARRWNAVLLIDEFDVYGHDRGDDILQNAIVGVFLRVLEYHAGLMFMTTNLGKKIDDAIVSRCTAVIEYEMPSKEAQARIWSVLSRKQGVMLSDAHIKRIVEKNPKLSGRDIKNLIKLARMSAAKHGETMTPDTVERVKRFKPTVETNIEDA